MKAFLLSLLLIISALLLAGLQCSAQPRESDRDWIDSLAVKYRMAFIESAMLLDQAAVDSMETRVNELILFSLNPHILKEGPVNTLLRLFASIGMKDKPGSYGGVRTKKKCDLREPISGTLCSPKNNSRAKCEEAMSNTKEAKTG